MKTIKTENLIFIKEFKNDELVYSETVGSFNAVNKRLGFNAKKDNPIGEKEVIKKENSTQIILTFRHGYKTVISF